MSLRIASLPLRLLFLFLFACVLRAERVPSEALRVRIPGFLDGRHDLEIVLLHQDGVFHNGYALLPGLDNILHRVDVTPTPPVAWETANGERFEPPPALRGDYAYRNQKEDFDTMRERYRRREIRIVHPEELPRLRREGDRVSGVIDVQILAMDASRGGRNPPGRLFRVALNLQGTRGAAVVRAYRGDRADDSFSADAPQQELPALHRWDADYWTPAPGSALSPEKSWPQAGGPFLTSAAQDADGELVDNLHDARLVWVAEDLLPGSSDRTRGEFSMRPHLFTGHGDDVFGSPAVAGNRVFLYTHQPAVEHLAAHPVLNPDESFVRLGIKPAVYGAKVDVVTAWDAQSGRRLWRFVGGAGSEGARGKATNGVTPLVIGGRVVIRGTSGLFALNAEDGALLWQQRPTRQLDLSLNNTPLSSVEASPVEIGGLIVMTIGRGGDLVALDPADGSLRWHARGVISHNQIPQAVTVGGQTRILAVGRSPGRNQNAVTTLLDAATGEAIWTSEAAGDSNLVLVEGDVLWANGVQQARNAREHRAAAFRVTETGLERLWVDEEAHYMGGRQNPTQHRGFVYADSRQTGFMAHNLRTGERVNRHPLIPDQTHGSHNWSWTVASNDRVFTSGTLMFSDAANGFHRLPGRLTGDLRGGYVCPVKPAIVDGRMFLRHEDRLVCYDLRKPADQPVRELRLRAENATLAGEAVDFRLRLPSGGIASVATRFPKRHLPNASRINNWVAWVPRTLDWRASPLTDWMPDASGLRGRQRLFMGWHLEDWEFDLAREGDRFQGHAIRRVPALEEPYTSEGGLFAHQHHRLADGRELYQVGLQDALLDRGGDRQALYLALTVENGRILHGFGSAGRVNGNNHEVDVTRLTLENGALRGEITLLTHDDRYGHLRESRDAVVAEYTLEGSLSPAGLAGAYRGTVGVAFERRVPVAGVLLAETFPGILEIAAAEAEAFHAGEGDGD